MVRGREIDRVGRADEVPVPPDARVDAVTGTIMPALPMFAELEDLEIEATCRPSRASSTTARLA